MISILRFLVIPFIVWGLYLKSDVGLMYAGCLFVIGCITDTIDGAVARSLGLSSRLGAVLDHTADKLIVIITLLALALLHYIDNYAAIFLIIMRDILMAALREMAIYQNISMPADFLGKTKTTLQMIAISLVFASYIFYMPLLRFACILLWVSVFFSLLSLVNYFIKALSKTNSFIDL